MLKKTVTYTDFDENERTEDFYFHLSKAEVMEMEFEVGGDMATKLRSIVDARDVKQIGEKFKDLILRSYGEKSSDGKRFIKSKEISDAFSQTQAYSDLFMEFCTNSNSAVEFVNGIMPKGLLKE